MDGLACQGYKLVGQGFVLSPEEGAQLLAADRRHVEIIKPYRNGRDLSARPRGVYLIDFGLMEEAEAKHYPVLYQRIRDRVKPERDGSRSVGMRQRWWQFGRPRGELRAALHGLSRYIATLEVSKHRFFTFLDIEVAPDGTLVCIGSDDSYHLGVLSSAIPRDLGPGGRWAHGSRQRPAIHSVTLLQRLPIPGCRTGTAGCHCRSWRAD